MKLSPAHAQAARLPEAPGIYRFLDSESKLIYVGKAKSLRKRVSSYFSKADQSMKTRRMVSEIRSIDYTLANSEADALLLENNFIKQYQPRYNILLKDDKTFPYICILRERFPRIISTRKYNPQHGEYYGPYSSVVAMKNVLDLIRKVHNVRTCSLVLSEDNIQKQKFRVCLEFHLGNCRGPCEGLQTEEVYLSEIEQARNILRGNVSLVDRYFRTRMKEASTSLEFERANQYKEKLELLGRFQSKSTVVNRRLTDTDVFALVDGQEYAYLSYMQIQEGAVILSHTVEVRKRFNEEPSEILSEVIPQLRRKFQSRNPVLLCSHAAEILGEEVTLLVPLRGDKKKLIELALKNAIYHRNQKALERLQREEHPNDRLLVLQKDLRLSSLPIVIECFDNSNFQGSSPVASMVRFENGKPDKPGYRHFNIKTVVGPDDFASMKEIVHRRYSRLLSEGKALPDLIVIDGGKGQLASACEALESLGIYGKTAVIAIAKRLEEVYFPGDTVPLHIRKNSVGLRLLQQIRNEAHRFAITFHRQKRSTVSLQTRSTEIRGIGKTTEQKLLKEYRSWKKIREASLNELASKVGLKKARLIKDPDHSSE